MNPFSDLPFNVEPEPTDEQWIFNLECRLCELEIENETIKGLNKTAAELESKIKDLRHKVGKLDIQLKQNYGDRSITFAVTLSERMLVNDPERARDEALREVSRHFDRLSDRKSEQYRYGYGYNPMQGMQGYTPLELTEVDIEQMSKMLKFSPQLNYKPLPPNPGIIGGST